MAVLSVEVIGDPLPGLGATLQDPGAKKRMLQDAVAAWRSVIREEFARESWNRPAGGFAKWAALKQPFGDFPPSAKTLSRSGALLNSYMGGPGAIYREHADSIEFGSALPYAAVHRGGGGKVLTAQASKPFKMPVTPKMRAFLRYHGVFLKGTTMFITIPRRPHATANPEVRTRIAAIFTAGLLGKPVPERLTA